MTSKPARCPTLQSVILSCVSERALLSFISASRSQKRASHEQRRWDRPRRPQGKSYPPKFVEGDTVKLELNKDTREIKMAINDGAAFTVGGIDPASKFFVNMEGKDSSIEIIRI